MQTRAQPQFRTRSRRRCVALLAVVGSALLGSLVTAAPAHATYAGRNGLIAFAADVGDATQLFTVRADGRHLKQITHVIGEAVAPDWSPDGRTIAYEHDLPGEQGATLVLVKPDGSAPSTVVAEPNVFFAHPAFSPDGTHLFFERFDPVTNVDAIWRTDLAGRHGREITRGIGFGVTDPNPAPNGRTLSFLAGGDGEPGLGLYTCSIDGKRLRELVPVSADLVNQHDWAPDGRHLAASDNHDQVTPGVSQNVFTVRPDGTHRHYLTHFSGGDVDAVMGSYSPDGRWIAFRVEDHGQFALYRMRAGGGSLQVIIPRSNFKPRYIDWGPVPTPTR